MTLKQPPVQEKPKTNGVTPKPFLHAKGKKFSSNHKRIEDIRSVISLWNLFLAYWSYFVVFIYGICREFFSRIGMMLGWTENPFATEEGYAPLLSQKDYFWLTRVYQRVRDCFERPIASAPGAHIQVMNRISHTENATYEYTGTTNKCLNLSSYNYLGFADNQGALTDSVAAAIRKYGVAAGSCRMEAGDAEVVRDLEEATARFVGKEAALVIGMGYATNSTTLPSLCGGSGTLIISDALNHASIVCGSRDSGAIIRVFKHNDPNDLEKVLQRALREGQPKTAKPWKRIFIIVEGIYSMEGEIAKLPEIVEIKKKYKAYLYVDEAHSIGALGKTGRGVCEDQAVDPADIDVLMGTYTKSFGSVGGYIAASKDFIDALRQTSYGTIYSTAMSPACAQQALGALRIIMGEDGTTEGQKRIERLHDNSNYFRQRLTELGFQVFGDTNSPVVPMMIYHVCALSAFTRTLLERGIAVVIVGFPVTPVLLSRVRFCISASHSREDIEFAVQQISELGDRFWLKYNQHRLVAATN